MDKSEGDPGFRRDDAVLCDRRLPGEDVGRATLRRGEDKKVAQCFCFVLLCGSLSEY
jgi:hypothetical protein